MPSIIFSFHHSFADDVILQIQLPSCLRVPTIFLSGYSLTHQRRISDDMQGKHQSTCFHQATDNLNPSASAHTSPKKKHSVFFVLFLVHKIINWCLSQPTSQANATLLFNHVFSISCRRYDIADRSELCRYCYSFKRIFFVRWTSSSTQAWWKQAQVHLSSLRDCRVLEELDDVSTTYPPSLSQWSW